MVNFSNFNSLHSVASYFSNEDKCKQAIVESRWSNGDIICPYCGQHHCNKRSDGRFCCSKCHKNFSEKVGTIFENTKISLTKWFLAMYLISSHKKGISSHQLAMDIEVTQKTAWFILQKIRTLFAQDDSIALSGDVECDEAYIGGKEKNKHESKKTQGTQGRSTKTKSPVFGMCREVAMLLQSSVTRLMFQLSYLSLVSSLQKAQQSTLMNSTHTMPLILQSTLTR